MLSSLAYGQKTISLIKGSDLKGVKAKVTVIQKAIPLKKTNLYLFTLPTPARVSAGVYKISDDVHVRTLITNKDFPAGGNNIGWNGLDDLGNAVSGSRSDYYIKVMYNNVTYTWEGPVGNNSDSITGSTVHKAIDPAKDLITTTNFVYYVPAYAEGQNFINKFSKTDLNKNLTSSTLTGNNALYAATTDNSRIYWAQTDPFGGNRTPIAHKSFVFATTVPADGVYTFSSGSTVINRFGPTFTSAIDLDTTATGTISGLAVMNVSPNYLFVAREAKNTIRVFNKTTGAFVQEITGITAPKKLAIEGAFLWVQSGSTTLQKFPINSDGTLAAPIAEVTGLLAPLAMSVSPDGTTIAVCDGSTSQQVKGFNTSTGVLSWTLGGLGGYLTNPDVTNYKFYFTDNVSTFYQFAAISYCEDGTFWVGDTGNRRLMHYTAGRTFIESMMYLPRPYSAQVVMGDSSRVFTKYMEFAIDYSKPLGGTNGSWTLKRNWGQPLGYDYRDNYFPKSFIKMSNGRTYAIFRQVATTTGEIHELTPEGTTRYTGVNVTSLASYLDKLGNIWTLVKSGATQTWNKRTLTGFSSNNPTYGAETAILSTTATTGSDPDFGGAWNSPTAHTGNGTVLWSFDGDAQNATAPFKFHLGAMKVSAPNVWFRKTAYATHGEYLGEFPSPERFDIGNGLYPIRGYAGNLVNTMDENVFTHYHGEFWKNSQAGMFNHYYSNGLAVGQFGAVGTQFPAGTIAPRALTGNGFSWQIVKIGTVYYIYQCDESHHAGITRWKIDNLASIKEVNIPITDKVVNTEPTLAGDLMTALPTNTTLVSATDWTLSHAATTGWEIYTNKLKPITPGVSPDLYVKRLVVGGDYWVKRDLKTTGTVTSWTLSGEVSWPNNQGNHPPVGGGVFVEVLDNTGKIIARLFWDVVESGNRAITLYGNTGVLMTGFKGGTVNNIYTPYLSIPQPFRISKSGSQVQFTYRNATVTVNVQEAGANVNYPKEFRILTTVGTYNRLAAVGPLSFISN